MAMGLPSRGEIRDYLISQGMAPELAERRAADAESRANRQALTTSLLAATASMPMGAAARAALQQAGWDATEVDLIVVATLSPDLYFSSRPFQYPDPIRFLDQRKTGRFGAPYTKVFESLHEQHLVIALDVSRATRGDIASSLKSDVPLSPLADATPNTGG